MVPSWIDYWWCLGLGSGPTVSTATLQPITTRLRPIIIHPWIIMSPPGEVNQAPPSGGQLFIYPRQGQSQEKLESDRDACHSWAVNQTGYDPNKPPPGGMPGSQIGQKSADYLRALDACLDARGYTVR